MLCPRCGGYVGEDDILCPTCGALIDRSDVKEDGVRGIRQGKRARDTASMGASRSAGRGRRANRAGASRVYVDPVSEQPDSETPIYAAPEVLEDGQPAFQPMERPTGRMRYGDTEEASVTYGAGLHNARGTHKVKRRMINWAHVTIGGVVVIMLMVVGVYLYLNNTAAGQKIMARMGHEATSTALWEVGEEKLDNGDIDGAIADFETARLQDGDENVNVDGLLLLASAYEAAGDVVQAEAIYTDVYTNITPTRPEPYRAVIRLMLAQSREPEAAVLMQTAYEMTGQVTFRQQRTELLPTAPSVDLTAGLYEQKKTLTLSSLEGYDIYYTFDDNAELPAGGVLYTEPIKLDEGIFNLRAVAVNDDLVSDMLSGTYKIIMPSPQTPRSSLAPNTYKQRQRIWLKPGLENEKDTDITIYYTIDGSTPDADSPIYTGEPFYLPGGRVYLKAVAVNGYGKASNTLEIMYKIEAKPYPLEGYTVEDVANGLTLYRTTREDFLEKYGSGKAMEEVQVEGIEEACQKYTYDWGYAVMAKTKTNWVLQELYFTSPQFSAPRGTGIGDEYDFVVSKFRDMGQVASPSGNRGLYDNSDGTGKIYLQEDGSRIVRYIAYTADSHEWQLDYITDKSGTVAAIDMIYNP